MCRLALGVAIAALAASAAEAQDFDGWGWTRTEMPSGHMIWIASRDVESARHGAPVVRVLRTTGSHPGAYLIDEYTFSLRRRRFAANLTFRSRRAGPRTGADARSAKSAAASRATSTTSPARAPSRSPTSRSARRARRWSTTPWPTSGAGTRAPRRVGTAVRAGPTANLSKTANRRRPTAKASETTPLLASQADRPELGASAFPCGALSAGPPTG